MSEQPIFRNGSVVLEDLVLTGNTAVSNEIDLRSSVGYSYQITYSDLTASGATVVAQASNDDTNFVDIPATSVTLNTSGSSLVNIERAMYKKARIKYTANSVTSGKLTVTVCVKGL